MAVADRIPLIPEARVVLNQRRARSRFADLFALLDAVCDPEIPVLSIWDLGILQDVYLDDDAIVHVEITPTYSGCPAMSQLTEDICATLQSAGYETIEIHQRLTPAWTTDWLDHDARKRLVEYGIASPDSSRCPQCGSDDTEIVSEFGSTACKAMMRCKSCLEPFDQFKRF